MQRRGPTSVLLPLPLPLLLALLLGAGECQKLERALLRPVKDRGLREPGGNEAPIGVGPETSWAELPGGEGTPGR